MRHFLMVLATLLFNPRVHERRRRRYTEAEHEMMLQHALFGYVDDYIDHFINID